MAERCQARTDRLNCGCCVDDVALECDRPAHPEGIDHSTILIGDLLDGGKIDENGMLIPYVYRRYAVMWREIEPGPSQ